jgi:hypothetical protein
MVHWRPEVPHHGQLDVQVSGNLGYWALEWSNSMHLPALTNEPFRVKYDWKIAYNFRSRYMAPKWSDEGILGSFSTETHGFSDATYVWKMSKYTCAIS